MSISANAQIEFEAGQTLVPMAALTDSGDHQTFTAASAPWSNVSGFTPEVFQNGLATGGVVTPAVSLTNDKIDVSALTCYLAGVLTSVAEDTDVSITRGLSTDTHNITSITVTSVGVIAAVSGTDGTAFSETRGAAGGPPLIPVGSIEIAQVRTTSITAAVVAASEILAIWGQHCERWDYPSAEINTMEGTVAMATALPLSHTGPVTKKVYAKYYTPVFQAVAKTLDFVPMEKTFSQTSQEYYGGSIGGSTEALAQGKFTALLDDGHTDALLGKVGENLTFRFRQDRNRAPYSLTQGRLGIVRSYQKTAQVQASCTISGESKTKDFTGT